MLISSPALRMGLDIGSTTIKLVLLDGENTRYSTYRRHHADILGELGEVLDDVASEYPNVEIRGAVTGSGGLRVATVLGLPFVQEVIAGTEAINRYNPGTDVVIELGGEDAKITYLGDVPEQRMNGTCAGGTGAFIDQMATLLGTDAAGLNELAKGYEQLYPIASRCGVFAKSDLQPLLNEGAPHTDLAASIFTSVVQQTISGLACGRPIRGNIVFLGGPLYFLSELRAAFRRILGDRAHSLVLPDRAQLYVAIGAALLADQAPVRLVDVVARAHDASALPAESHRMRPLFADDAEKAAFDARHAQVRFPRRELSTARGDCFLGIDAGSTTMKAALIDSSRRLVWSWYGSNEADPVGTAVRILSELLVALPADARIARTCVTGYGEGLVKAALHAEDGEVETMAHYRAAEYLSPGVTAVIDIGGQDMKYLRIRDGVIDSICVNEACSSGCGSFLQTFAQTMGTDVESFAHVALDAGQPVDLGSRCTVFMNSSVKAAQKEGAGVGDISAGLAYSVVRNALYKVIKLKDPTELGERVVVQGGTFLNDAVLRAFELLTEREVVRPDIAGLMGAFGAALTAQNRYREIVTPEPRQRTITTIGQVAAPIGAMPPPEATLLDLAELRDFSVTTEKDICLVCQNHCQRTISTFADGKWYLSGNRCDRGAQIGRGTGRKARSELPNVFDAKYKRLFAYRRLTEAKAHRGDLGIPRALNLYENYPFWFTVFTKLGFRVLISGRSSRDQLEKGMDSIASENICYPAKLVHGHIEDLVERGVRTIFYPSIAYERTQFTAADNQFNCPVVMSYPEVIAHNVTSLREQDVRLIRPFLTLSSRDHLVRGLVEAFADWGIDETEMAEAVAAGFAEDAAVRADVRQMGRDALAYMAEHGVGGIVLAGRPYHLDPEINHGVPDLVNSLGMAVLTEDCLLDGPDDSDLERPLRVRDQWAYHSRLYEVAALCASRPDLEVVQLNSFGCGLDAITTDQVAEILEARNRVYTCLKIDEVSNLGAARIRLRSLKASTAERAVTVADRPTRSHVRDRVVFTGKMRKEHTLLLPQMAPIHFSLLEAAVARSGYRIQLLPKVRPEAIETGLRHVNNDACYPALVVIGQLIDALKSGEFDPANASVLMSQTGGMCRATNYAGLLRKGLADAGFGHVPVVALSTQGIEKNPGFKYTPALLNRLTQSILLGDLLQTVLLRVRPYEIRAGSADALYRKWDAAIREFFTYGGYSPTLRKHLTYRRIARLVVADFVDLPRRSGPRKERVGIVGEILVKFHPDANNDVVRVVESEGCEAVIPGLTAFVLNGMATADWNFQTYGVGTDGARKRKNWTRDFLERYQKPIADALAEGRIFDVPMPILELAEKASHVVSLGNQAGEGWLLTAEMIELIETGTPNIICTQPFACLPNHVTGKGVFRELRRRYPQANIVGVDYDPGASVVNQLNRIKLMISGARSRRVDADRVGERTRQRSADLVSN